MNKHVLREHLTVNRQANDFYATKPDDVRIIMELENIKGLKIFEPCAGQGHMAEELMKDNVVITNELYNYGYNTNYNFDFLTDNIDEKFDMVVMNPPYKGADKFVLKALDYSDKVIVFQKLSFLEGQNRYRDIFSQGILKTVYVYSYRTLCAKEGDFEKYNCATIAFAWYVFDKNYNGDPEIKWITKEEL